MQSRIGTLVNEIEAVQPLVDQVVEAVLGEAPLAGPPGVVDPRRAEAAVGDHPADVRVIVVELPQRVDDLAVDELELADVDRDLDVGEPAHRAVIDPADRPHEAALLARSCGSRRRPRSPAPTARRTAGSARAGPAGRRGGRAARRRPGCSAMPLKIEQNRPKLRELTITLTRGSSAASPAGGSDGAVGGVVVAEDVFVVVAGQVGLEEPPDGLVALRRRCPARCSRG